MTTRTDGLEDVVATHSRICNLDGKLGKLTYYGVDIHDLAEHSSFEETAYLLWYGMFPTKKQLESLQLQLRASRVLPGQIIEMMHLLPRITAPMDVVRTIVSSLSSFDDDLADSSLEKNRQRAVRLMAAIPTIIATWEHIRHDRSPVMPLSDYSHATNLLYMLNGQMPDPFLAHVLDMVLILHADHELNASTFAARVTAATLADMYAAITSAVGALSGCLHGGANEQVMKMLLRIGDVENVDAYIAAALERKERIMGFGHRVYRTVDPRAEHLRALSEALGQQRGESKWYDISRAIESCVKERKGLNVNVDFYSASVYYMMGIPIELDTALFACSRIAGWTAHVLEQYEHNRLIRPRAEYDGPIATTYVPIEQRGD